MRNRWFGRAILFIAALHTVGAVLIFGPVWSDVLADGLAGTILLFGDSARMSAFWFLFAGLFLGFVGGLIDWIESRELPVPAAVGWALALLTAAGIAMMPVSGFCARSTTTYRLNEVWTVLVQRPGQNHFRCGARSASRKVKFRGA